MEKINNLLQKDMTRKEFLATIGFGVASVFGLATLLRLLTGKEAMTTSSNSYGYGGGTYGGRKTS
jgi:hypothetical protein